MNRTSVLDSLGHVRTQLQDRQHTLKGVVLSGCPVEAHR
jgi:hypothetical protein